MRDGYEKEIFNSAISLFPAFAAAVAALRLGNCCSAPGTGEGMRPVQDIAALRASGRDGIR
ncbi:MAG: hypothetical protein OEM01_06705 [Desulfobulbaceae bacterium]|nr:hypothetical protein [Desulfobulbaceae bacterium]